MAEDQTPDGTDTQNPQPEQDAAESQDSRRRSPLGRMRRGRTGVRGRHRRARRENNWWTRRWLDNIEGFDIGSRLGRGRNYARRGHVKNLTIQRGRVTAEVHGSRPDPYEVRVKVRTLPRGAWLRIARLLAENPDYVAAIKAGEVPEEVERFFREARQHLFPNKESELAAECSCPDWSNPCKHSAAVYYVVGDAIDRDPFMMFRLRGMDRKALLRLVERATQSMEDAPSRERPGDAPGAASPDDTPAGVAGDRGGEDESGPPRERGRPEAGAQRTRRRPPRAPEEEEVAALPTATDRFWGRAPVRFSDYGDVSVPLTAAALPKRLGGFPMWRGAKGFMESVEPSYQAAAEAGMELFVGGSAARRAARSRAAKSKES